MNKKILFGLCLLLFVILFIVLNNCSREKLKFNNTNANDSNKTIEDLDQNKDLDNQIIDEDLLNSVDLNNIEEKHYYFGYGSNMDINLLRRRIGNPTIVPESYGLLENYKLIFPRGVGSVVPNQDYNVYGCVFLLTEKELKKLDVVEGYRKDRDRLLNSYNRELIEIILPNKEKIIADIYIQVKETEDLPSNTYKQTIIKGANDCNLPREYVNWLEDLETR
jgi:gamma-glutamylcyclotransferase (GGCT)/AIG2-like uncharacterized protein YtfP